MAKITDTLDTISGSLFLFGLIFSKIKLIPLRFFSPIFTSLSLSAYLLGYGVWYLAAVFYPDHPGKRDKWYGFAEFKEQYQVAAIIGGLATIACLVNPSLIVIPLGLYALSNIFWSVSEYHKYRHPPTYNPNYSSARQEVYLHYVFLTTGASIFTAAAAVFVIASPATAGTTLILSTIIGSSLGMAAFYYWAKSTFGSFAPDNKLAHSYQQFSQDLSFPLAQSNKLEPSRHAEPNHFSMWQKPCIKFKNPTLQESVNSSGPRP